MLKRWFRLAESDQDTMPMPAVKLYTIITRSLYGIAALAVAAASTGVAAADAAGGIRLDPMARHYQLGHGLTFGDSGFRAGGYGVLGARDTDEDEEWTAAIEAISAFLWWEGDSEWRFFAEVEVEDALFASPGRTTTDDASPRMERLYFDYAWRDAAKFRIGKFLTPVGRWNLIHAAPLVWTSSRPLITESTFPTNATGAMVYGVLPSPLGAIDYSVYASPGHELFPAPDLDTFSEAYGGRVGLNPVSTLQLGLSFVDFELASSNFERRKLYGFDFHWSWNRVELSGEFGYRVTRLSQSPNDERGGYLQLVVPLSDRLYGVTRYETFEDAVFTKDMNLYLLGLTYRYLPALVFKAEYSEATDNEIGVVDGLRGSIAVLF
jgi:hypothetical protein